MRQVLCKPGLLKPSRKFEASVYALTKEEGGRHTPFFTNYRPQLFFRTADVTASVSLGEGREMVMPGDNAEVRRMAHACFVAEAITIPLNVVYVYVCWRSVSTSNRSSHVAGDVRAHPCDAD